MNRIAITPYIHWFQHVLSTAFQLYFRQECAVSSVRDITPPDPASWNDLFGTSPAHTPGFDEKVIVMLALMPHLYPQGLDLFFVINKNFDRPYTEFGGWKGNTHSGFLPTGETAVFILAGEDMEKRKEIMALLSPGHWLYRHQFVRLDGHKRGEPMLSGQLCATEELISRVLYRQDFKPDYSIDFPAKRITTTLSWDDLVLDYQLASEIEEINTWIGGHDTVMRSWGLDRFLKSGYRALFYGPPGTGKTLTATLIGQKNGLDVYRIDLSMIVSKYIGETEKNLARIFDRAENRDWILFFDEADALFGKRTSTQTSNDRHANQEVAYLLQRIEDFPGTVLLASNLRSNIDEAFSRRFQSVIYFPMPDEKQRRRLWKNMLPPVWLGDRAGEWIELAAAYELSGGSIANVVRRCALQLLSWKEEKLTKEILQSAIQKELIKEGKI